MPSNSRASHKYIHTYLTAIATFTTQIFVRVQKYLDGLVDIRVSSGTGITGSAARADGRRKSSRESKESVGNGSSSMSYLQRRRQQLLFLDLGLLRVIRLWLEPYDDGSLPPVPLQKLCVFLHFQPVLLFPLHRPPFETRT